MPRNSLISTIFASWETCGIEREKRGEEKRGIDGGSEGWKK